MQTGGCSFFCVAWRNVKENLSSIFIGIFQKGKRNADDIL